MFKGYTTQMFKNFKIYTDTSGTIPFLSLPFQNPGAIAVDTVGGLVGTNTNVRLINNMENVMKDRNLWSYFDGITNKITFVDSDIFSMSNGVNDVSAKWEFSLITGSDITTAQILLSKGSLSSQFEWDIFIQTGRLYINLFNNNTNTAYIQSYVTILANTQYNVLITYDGSVTVNGITITLNNISVTNTRTTTGIYVGMLNINSLLYIGGITTYFYKSYLRNIKITKANQLVFYLPLTDNVNIGKDIVGGLQGTVTGTINVVDI
jgi:hypothetical protein